MAVKMIEDAEKMALKPVALSLNVHREIQNGISHGGLVLKAINVFLLHR